MASVGGVVATSRTVGSLFAYRLHWAWVLGMVGGVLRGLGGVDAGHLGPGARARRGVSVAFAVLTVLRGASIDAVRADPPRAAMAELVADLATDGQPIDEMPGDGPVLVQMASFGAIGTGLGLVDELERAASTSSSTTRAPASTGSTGTASRCGPLLVGVDIDVGSRSTSPDHELIALAGDGQGAARGRGREERAPRPGGRRGRPSRSTTCGALAGDQPPPYSAGASSSSPPAGPLTGQASVAMPPSTGMTAPVR